MIFLTHICKYRLRINSGFLHREQKRTTRDFLQLLLKILALFIQLISDTTSNCGGLIALSLISDPRYFLLFSLVPGFHRHGIRSRLTHWDWCFVPLLYPSPFGFQVENRVRNTSQWEQLQTQSPSLSVLRDFLQSRHFLVSLCCLTFFFLHSLCIQCLFLPGSFALLLLCFNVFKFNIPSSSFILFMYPQVTS